MMMRSVEYLTSVPRPDDVPAGHVVVHNHVAPQPKFGAQGFRVWLAADAADARPAAGALEQAAAYRVEACDCGWAPELGAHYRVPDPGVLREPVHFRPPPTGDEGDANKKAR